jgi:hypothetical protein
MEKTARRTARAEEDFALENVGSECRFARVERRFLSHGAMRVCVCMLFWGKNGDNVFVLINGPRPSV